MEQAKFCVISQLPFAQTYEGLEMIANQQSEYSTDCKREGIMVKVSNESELLHRFKMVGPGFKPGERWDAKQIHPQPKTILLD